MRRRGNKHGAVKTTVHGITFASKAEAQRYQELLLQGLAGEITDLEIQPRFRLDVNQQHIADYVADFRYRIPLIRRDIVEDVKSSWTRTLPVYRLKKKLMKAIHGIDIYEHGA